MTEVLAPPVGEVLTAETVKLLVKGDVLFSVEDAKAMTVVAWSDGGGYVSGLGDDGLTLYPAQGLKFVGRPDADGWIVHEGGPNPAPGRGVQIRARLKFWNDQGASSDYCWDHYPAGQSTNAQQDIIAYRIARPSLAAPTVQGAGQDSILLPPQEASVPDMNKSGDASLREAAVWQSTADNPPPSGFYLAHEDGAIRTMMFHDGQWDLPDFPVLVLETGDRLVPREVAARGRGETLAMCQMIYSPTHWMPLPDAPETPND